MTTINQPLCTPYGEFGTTRWSVVRGVQGKSQRDPFESLEALCRQYWLPLYVYARRRVNSPHDAEDLTQGFFAELLEKHWLKDVKQKRERGGFRAFLRKALDRYINNEWHREQAQKRGGGVERIPLDGELAERLYVAGSASALPPDLLYDKRWGLSLMESAMARLREAHETPDWAMKYDLLKEWMIVEDGKVPYEELAEALGTNEVDVRQILCRLRKRFRKIFREEVARTVSDPADVDEEIRAVIAAIVRN